ncbi:MAG: hypothetical protein WDN06_10805 [Asticcacaulis sp.]
MADEITELRADLGALSPTALAEGIEDALIYRIGKDRRAARPRDWLTATVLTIRDRIIDKWMASTRAAHAAGAKRVYYLSLEFLIGRLLRDALSNLGVMEPVREALQLLEVDLDIIRELGARRGARQWRPWPAGGLLHGKPGLAGAAGLRLRHPLRQRHVPPAHRRWLAGRTAGNLAGIWQSVGVRAPGKLLQDFFRR